MQDAVSAVCPLQPLISPGLHQQLTGSGTPPGPCEQASLAMRPAPPAGMSALDPSVPSPASGSQDFHTLPATRTQQPPAAVSARPGTGLSSPRPQTRRESGAESAAARVASHRAPY